MRVDTTPKADSLKEEKKDQRKIRIEKSFYAMTSQRHRANPKRRGEEKLSRRTLKKRTSEGKKGIRQQPPEKYCGGIGLNKTRTSTQSQTYQRGQNQASDPGAPGKYPEQEKLKPFFTVSGKIAD